MVSGLTEDECNQILNSAKYPNVNSNSWKMVNKYYVPAFKQDMSLMGKCIFKPQSIGDLMVSVEEINSMMEPPSKPSLLDRLMSLIGL